MQNMTFQPGSPGSPMHAPGQRQASIYRTRGMRRIGDLLPCALSRIFSPSCHPTSAGAAAGVLMALLGLEVGPMAPSERLPVRSHPDGEVHSL